MQAVDRMKEFFSSENCEIIYGERHVQSWEWNTAAIPFSFKSFSEFARFLSESEIKFHHRLSRPFDALKSSMKNKEKDGQVLETNTINRTNNFHVNNNNFSMRK